MLPNQSELIKYLTNLQSIFVCLYYSANRYSDTSNELRNHITQLLRDFSEHLIQLSKSRGTFLPLINTIQEYTLNILTLIHSNEVTDPELVQISKDFLELTDIDPALRTKLSHEPRDLLYIAFNVFSLGVCRNRFQFLSDTVESANPIKNLTSIYLNLQSEHSMNHTYKMENEPVLITGVCDFI